MTIEAIMGEVRTLSVGERKRLIRLIVDSLTEPVATDDTDEKEYDILDFEGVGAEMWKDIDVDKFLNDMRDEWDKPRENQ